MPYKTTLRKEELISNKFPTSTIESAVKNCILEAGLIDFEEPRPLTGGEKVFITKQKPRHPLSVNIEFDIKEVSR